MTYPIVISAAVEGDIDEAVARRLIMQTGALPGDIYGKSGKKALRQRIGGYNNAAKHSRWLVLVDLNGDAECAPELCREWIPSRSPQLCFRVAVRQVEAWLLGDAETLSAYLAVARSRIPRDPESLENPKVKMVSLAQKSRKKNVRMDMVPREGSGRAIGPAYTSRMIEYIERFWRPDVAANGVESLRRALSCLKRLLDAPE